MTCLIVTGATGYIGGYVVRGARARGWRVVAASRRRPEAADMPWIPYRLDGELHGDDFEHDATILHLAAETRAGSGATEDVEVAAARRLLDVAHERRLRIVFVSSQVARRDAPTSYGRTKWRVEQEVLKNGGWVVRPGLVYGGRPGGLFGLLLEQVRSGFALPALLPSPRVQPIHVADLAEGLLKIVERNDVPPGAYNLAAPEPVSFTEFLRAIAAVRVRRRRLYLPVPVVALKLAVQIANSVLARSYDLGRIRSLTELPPLASAEDLAVLGLQLRPLTSGMHPSGSNRRRRLLLEGRGLLGYVLGYPVPPSPVKRYVRAVERVRDGEAVAIPRIALDWPWCIAVLDSRKLLVSAGAAELDWRLNAATVLAEATPFGARRFMIIGKPAGVAAAIMQFVTVALSELFWRVVRTFVYPFLRRAVAPHHVDR